jgi:cytochrome d ubiquinol oxidase subunit I
MIMTPSGFGAVLFGWFTAEIGRQPFVVYGQLRTADAVSPVAEGAVTASLLIFVVVYAFVFGFGSYYLAKLLRRGPDPVEDIRHDGIGKKPKRPLSVPDEGIESGSGYRRQPAE